MDTAYVLIHVDTTREKPRIVNAGIYSSRQITSGQGVADLVAYERSATTYHEAREKIFEELDHPYFFWIKNILNKSWTEPDEEEAQYPILSPTYPTPIEVPQKDLSCLLLGIFIGVVVTSAFVFV